MPSTIKDVARYAGVGVGTVSRVLNGSPLVSEETREKVLVAIQTLEYVPNTFARRLSLGKTLTIGVIAPFFTRPSVVERLRGIEQLLSETQYDLNIFNLETIDRRKRCIDDIVRSSKVDGLLVVSIMLTAEESRRLIDAGIVTVQIDADSQYFSQVIIDDEQGGWQATNHLIALGHRKIGFISDHFNTTLGNNSQQHRYYGYKRALTEANIEINPAYIVQCDHSRQAAYDATQQLLELNNPPMAIFAASDTQAIGVIEAAADFKIKVADELSIVGYDDIEVAEYLNLTTIRQPLHETGIRGTLILLDALNGDDQALQKVVLETELVQRGTTAPIKETASNSKS